MISTLVLSTPPYLFDVGLIVLPAQFFVLGSFFSSETLAITSLPTQIFFSFWGGFGFVLLFSEALLLLDEPCLSGIYVASNVGLPSKSDGVELALVELSSKICKFFTLMTLF